MQLNTGRAVTLLLLIVAVGAVVVAFQQTERFNLAQDAAAAANATAAALGTQSLEVALSGEATLTAIGESAQAQIDDVRGAASTLQAGSLGTRIALEAEIQGLQTTAEGVALIVSAQAADAESAAAAQVDFATQAAATQAGQATQIASAESDLQQAQATSASVQRTATADAAAIATLEAEIQAMATQIAEAEASAQNVTSIPPTPRIAPTATPSASAQTLSDARVRRDDILAAFPQPFLVGEIAWTIADDPEFQFDQAEEASLALLLTNDTGERVILNVYFGSDAARYAALVEQAIPALNLTPFETQPTGFPSPGIFGRNPQAYEAIWAQGTILARVTLLTNESDGDTTLIAFARTVLDLLSSI